MLPLIQWIERVPEKGRLLIATRKENLRPLAEYLADRLDDLNELVYVGSGSSYNSVMSVKGWIERITKLKVSVMTPNEYLYDRTVRNPNALTIFPSQSGTSVTTRKALQSAQRQGLPNVAVTQNPNQYMSQECGVHVDMMCADEEYKMRTVGYVSGMVVQLLIAMEIGLRRHTITAEEEQKLIAQIEAALTNWPQIETQAMTWYKRNETQLLNSAMFAVYGIDGLWGAALEGALKLINLSPLAF